METRGNIMIEKFGEQIVKVRFVGANRQADEKELQAFIAGRPFTRYVNHFDPNTQIIELHPPEKTA